MKIKNGLRLFNFIFISLGLLIIVGGIFLMIQYANFQKTAVMVEAKIVEIETYREQDSIKANAYVTYVFDGATYEHVLLDYYYNTMQEGMIIDILCDPEAPWKIERKESFHSGGAWLIVFGLVFFLIGAVPVTKSLVRNAKKNNLLSEGNTIYAIIQSIDVNTSISFNNLHPYQIVCSYGSYIFKSENLWTDIPSLYQVGDTIEVVVNPQDYSQYFVTVREQ